MAAGKSSVELNEGSDLSDGGPTEIAANLSQIRDRVRELRRVPARDLFPNRKNWRRHPKTQANALRGLLNEIGYADALLVRQLPDGRLMLIDGHLRAKTTPDVEVPVLILDVTEEQADKLLLSLDPLAAMAESDSERIKALLVTVRTNSPAVEELFKRTAGNRLWEVLHPEEVTGADVSPVRADELRKKCLVAGVSRNDPVRSSLPELTRCCAPTGDLIFDPFAGSGSTIVAAHQLGRVGYGCEIDPGYLAVSLEWLSILGLKPRLVG